MPEYAWNALRIASKQYLKRRVDLRVEGQHHLPRSGPVLIAARHYHHLLDGAVLMATVPYPMHILVGLDWVKNPLGQRAMKALCEAAGWPVVMRRDGKHPIDDAEAQTTLRRAYCQSLDILRKGHALLVFPEGYPNIDPTWTPKTQPDEFLPFQPGFVQIVRGAERLGVPTPIVPAGFHYDEGDRWSVTLRFGAPLGLGQGTPTRQVLERVEDAVKELSLP
jgi:1-acyl-sn-glycerol-3-phosphate acyltransferase